MSILSRKLTNQVKKEALKRNITIHTELKNIRRNGTNFGCSGFIGNLANGRVVYVNTETGFSGDRMLYRYAKDMKDYGGSHSHNQFADDSKDLVQSIMRLLEQSTPHRFYTKEAS